MTDFAPPHPLAWEGIVEVALREDLGAAGDLTTDSIVSSSRRATGRIVAREAGRIAGLGVALAVFRRIDLGLETEPVVEDGADVEPGELLATVAGPARGILTGERTALNILGRLSGIATATRGLAAAIEGTGARVVCTRKTTPGLRALEKYAVRVGGGANHRFGLGDAVLVKDNHVAIAGGVADALRRARAGVGHLVAVEVEVDTLEQLEEALEAGVDAVLLDNMAPGTLREAVRRVGDRAVTEASGGITGETIRAVAETGVDLISVGWLTHSAPALDVSLEVEPD